MEKNSDGSDNSKQEIGNLTKQFKELRQQLEEVKQSLKGMLEEAKDYAQKLFNWFKKENIEQITFEEDGSAKVKYEDNKNSKTISASEIKNNQELLTLKEYSRQSQQKSLSHQELSQIVGSTSSPTSTEKSHWETYKYYYFVGVGVTLLAMGGLMVYWWMKKDKRVIE